MSGYIIHFDNDSELAHYGVKGMKWGKHKRTVDKNGNIWEEEIGGTGTVYEKIGPSTYRINKYETSSKKKSLKPKKQLHGTARRTAIARRARAYEKKNPNLFKTGLPKSGEKGYSGEKSRKVGTSGFTDWGGNGATPFFRKENGKYAGNKFDREVARKVIARVNKARFNKKNKTQKSTIEKGYNKVKKWFKNLF